MKKILHTNDKNYLCPFKLFFSSSFFAITAISQLSRLNCARIIKFDYYYGLPGAQWSVGWNGEGAAQWDLLYTVLLPGAERARVVNKNFQGKTHIMFQLIIVYSRLLRFFVLYNMFTSTLFIVWRMLCRIP